MSKTTAAGRARRRALLLLGLVLWGGGCADERVANVAREAADRQAEQNRQIAHQSHQVAETTKQLVAADAQARRELIALQKDLQARQAAIAQQQDCLEAERRQMAAQRQLESILGPAIESLGLVLVAALVLAFCCLLAHGLRKQGSDSDPTISELLVADLVSPQPLLLPPFPPPPGTTRLLPPPQDGGHVPETPDTQS